jgi:hypothetical protein
MREVSSAFRNCQTIFNRYEIFFKEENRSGTLDRLVNERFRIAHRPNVCEADKEIDRATDDVQDTGSTDLGD